MSSKPSLGGWLVPIVAIIFIVAFAWFVRAMIGPTSAQQMQYGTKPFVPAESPYSTGPNSR